MFVQTEERVPELRREASYSLQDDPFSLFKSQHIFGGLNEPVNYLTLFSNCFFFFYVEDIQGSSKISFCFLASKNKGNY